jgi:HSP20 family molecular chaperone IbpA
MPGVSNDRLSIRVEGGTLLIEGSAQIELPQEAHAERGRLADLIRGSDLSSVNEHLWLGLS